MTKILKHIFHAVFAILLALASIFLTSCGSDGSFRINGEIEGYGTGNLRVVYMYKGTLQNVTATAIDGKFSMSGRATEPVLARLYTGNGRFVGALIADDGETIDARFNLAQPSAVSYDGNKDSERLAAFLHANAEALDNGNHTALNQAIAEYVRANGGQYTSGALMAAYFHTPGHEAEAMELIALLSDDVNAATSLRGLADMLLPLTHPVDSTTMSRFQVFITADSALTVDPAKTPLSLVMITKADTRRSDSVTATLGRLASIAKNGKLQVIDISADADTAAWRTSLRDMEKADSAGYRKQLFVKRGWAPAPYSIYGLEEVPVAATPWFVVADSAGHVLYRGAALSKAADAVTLK